MTILELATSILVDGGEVSDGSWPKALEGSK